MTTTASLFSAAVALVPGVFIQGAETKDAEFVEDPFAAGDRCPVSRHRVHEHASGTQYGQGCLSHAQCRPFIKTVQLARVTREDLALESPLRGVLSLLLKDAEGGGDQVWVPGFRVGVEPGDHDRQPVAVLDGGGIFRARLGNGFRQRVLDLGNAGLDRI